VVLVRKSAYGTRRRDDADLRTTTLARISKVNFEAIAMPSLFRFLTVVAVIGGLIYGGIFALANFVNPKPREITVSVPPDKFLKR
jgi:hypothetical protein